MIKVLKEMWHKWRVAVCLAQVEICGMKRLELKEKQLNLKKQAEVHSGVLKELKKQK